MHLKLWIALYGLAAILTSEPVAGPSNQKSVEAVKQHAQDVEMKEDIDVASTKSPKKQALTVDEDVETHKNSTIAMLAVTTWNPIERLKNYGIKSSPITTTEYDPLWGPEPTKWYQESENVRHANFFLYRKTRATKNLTGQQSENHKPIFTKCSKYKPTVKEEEPVGTYVFTIHAEDPDPRDAGGTVTYKLLENPGDKEKFTLDPTTGDIHTNDVFDHDEPSREKEAFITVRASDNGRPQLDDACTIKIIIEDINDNQPVFDKVAYSESVPQDLLPGFEVMRMSATDIDDGINSIVHYSLDSESTDHTYFYIDPDNGVILLNKTIDKSPGYRFKLSAIVTDMGVKPLQSSITLNIDVIESNKKSPSFVEVPKGPIVLKESYNDYHTPIATIKAVSNIPEQTKLHYELVQGQTEQTNKLTTFVLELKDDHAVIRLSGNLDYERITEYTLTVRIQNNYRLATETKIEIQIEDVNDNIPKFAKIDTVTVPENEPPGTQVIQVQAFDADATYPFNHVSYVMDDPDDPFAVDPITGNVTTLKMFDREEKAFYNILVLAVDEGESALTPPNPNKGQLLIAIEIADRNDNPPRFTQETYVAESIAENANINELVTIVQAKDPDTASVITYSIVNGNTYDAFVIKNVTGEIRVNNVLDYENITTYSLDVKAFDGLYEDYAKVIINIENINDNPPVFIANYTNTIDEETIVQGCVVTVEAYDPDIKDRSLPQRIQYSLVKTEQQDLMEVDSTGCITLKKPLDRDPPNGFARWQILVMASDNMGKSPADSLRSTTEVILILNDINDNAPELAMNQPVRWMENEPPGLITVLIATDRDTPENGPPFTFSLSSRASTEIRNKFEIRGDDLYALVRFDREQQKFYSIPILISDSGRPPMANVSNLLLEIGDKNDNMMQSGFSTISVFNYVSTKPSKPPPEELMIGTAYVEDPDDWDRGDKNFAIDPVTPANVTEYFIVRSNGDIIMKTKVPPGVYNITIIATEENLPTIKRHSKHAYVLVHVKHIPDYVVFEHSGSFRFANTTSAKFFEVQVDGLNMRDRLASAISNLLDIKLENIDIFTVIDGFEETRIPYIDVRYSGHGSPYYDKAKLDSTASLLREEFETALGLNITMVGVDDCLYKPSCPGCKNDLNVYEDRPIVIMTNKTSFVGINANAEADCRCEPRSPEPAPGDYCLNGGTLVGPECECPYGYDGKHCELISIGFSEAGFTMYPSPALCAQTRFTFNLLAHCNNCLVLYFGPNNYNPRLPSTDFISLEIRDGYLVVTVNLDKGSSMASSTSIVADGKSHFIEVTIAEASIEIKIDYCSQSNCTGLGDVPNNRYFAISGQLYVGGVNFDLEYVAERFNWTYRPPTTTFLGCVHNLTVNEIYVNLGVPILSKNADATCQTSTFTAVSFGINTNFLIVIIVCIVILIVLLLGVVVHRKKSDEWAEKEMDDIRENIIAYEDEGGGEGDAGYNLHVLRQMFEAPPEGDAFIQHPAAAPNISGFLDDKKTVMDRDPEFNPYDDVRHYAYEGDGNSSGTLSSLASCWKKWCVKQRNVNNETQSAEEVQETRCDQSAVPPSTIQSQNMITDPNNLPLQPLPIRTLQSGLLDSISIIMPCQPPNEEIPNIITDSHPDYQSQLLPIRTHQSGLLDSQSTFMTCQPPNEEIPIHNLNIIDDQDYLPQPLPIRTHQSGLLDSHSSIMTCQPPNAEIPVRNLNIITDSYQDYQPQPLPIRTHQSGLLDSQSSTMPCQLSNEEIPLQFSSCRRALGITPCILNPAFLTTPVDFVENLPTPILHIPQTRCGQFDDICTDTGTLEAVDEIQNNLSNSLNDEQHSAVSVHKNAKVLLVPIESSAPFNVKKCSVSTDTNSLEVVDEIQNDRSGSSDDEQPSSVTVHTSAEIHFVPNESSALLNVEDISLASASQSPVTVNYEYDVMLSEDVVSLTDTHQENPCESTSELPQLRPATIKPLRGILKKPRQRLSFIVPASVNKRRIQIRMPSKDDEVFFRITDPAKVLHRRGSIEELHRRESSELIEELQRSVPTDLMEELHRRVPTELVEEVHQRVSTELVEELYRKTSTELAEESHRRVSTELVEESHPRRSTELVEELHF